MASKPPAPLPRKRRSPPRERTVLDSAHLGDIQGAFGTIREHDSER